MTDDPLQIINSLLNSEKRHLIENSNVIVKESAKDSDLKKVTITGVNDDAVALDFDKMGHTGRHVFNTQHKKVHKACDAMIFCKLENKYFVLFCELKTSLSDARKDITQLRSSYCWLKYLQAILEEFENLSIANWERRYVTFHHTNFIPKHLTLNKPSRKHSPSSPLILKVENNEEIPLRKLLQEPL